MMRKLLPAASAVVLVVVMIACESNRGPLAPTSPSVFPAGGSATLMPAIADPGLPQEEVTLKATQPALVTPADTAIVNEPAAVLTVANPQSRFVSAVFFIRFEVWDLSGAPQPVLIHSAIATQGAGSTDYTLPEAVLQDTTVYAWRARAERNGAVGPWSGVFGFTTVFVRIDPPVPLVPIGGVVVSTLFPIFTVANGAVTGDAGTVLIEVEVSVDPNFNSVVEVARTTMRDRGETNISLRTALQLDTLYFWRARGTNEDLPITAVLPNMPPPQAGALIQTVTEVMSDWSSTETFRTPEMVVTSTPPASGGGGNFTPGGSVGAPFTTSGGDPPNLAGVVQQIAAQNPGALSNSCPEEGGNFELMDRVVEALRAIDGRWAYNCKRGDCNSLSVDVISYYRGSGNPNGSTDVSLIDIIFQVCGEGANPQPTWIDVTDETHEAGAIGRWIYPR